MLALVHDQYCDHNTLARQVAELRRLPAIERIALLADTPTAAEAQGAEWYTWAQGMSLARLARFSNGRPILKINDRELVSAETVERILAAHAEGQRPVTVFCPGPNDFVYISNPVVELFDPTRIESQYLYDRLNTAIRGLIQGWVYTHRAAVWRWMPARFYRAIRQRYYRWLDAEQAELNGEVLVLPYIELTDKSLPREQINVFTGDVHDKLYYTVERVHEFFPFPRDIHYVLTNLCNLRCVMCPYHSDTARALRKTNFFDRATFTQLDDFRRVAEEAAVYGATLRFGQLEEALYHKQLEQLVALARQAGVPDVHLTTKWHAANAGAGRAAAGRRPDLGCRQHRCGYRRDISPDPHRRRFSDRGREHAPTHQTAQPQADTTVLRVAMILQGRAIEEKERFIEFWRNEGIDQVTVYQLSEYDESGRIILKKTYYDHAELGRYACAAPWLEAFVYPTGEVSLCCWTLELVPTKGILAVGNVREKRLSEIWIDEPYRRVREQLITNRFQDRLAREACKDCYVWSSSTYRRKWFGGEMSVLYNESMATYEFV